MEARETLISKAKTTTIMAMFGRMDETVKNPLKEMEELQALAGTLVENGEDDLLQRLLQLGWYLGQQQAIQEEQTLRKHEKIHLVLYDSDYGLSARAFRDPIDADNCYEEAKRECEHVDTALVEIEDNYAVTEESPDEWQCPNPTCNETWEMHLDGGLIPGIGGGVWYWKESNAIPANCPSCDDELKTWVFHQVEGGNE